MQLEVRSEILKVIVVWQLVLDLSSESNRRLIRLNSVSAHRFRAIKVRTDPAASHVADGVAATAEHHDWLVELFDKLKACRMA